MNERLYACVEPFLKRPVNEIRLRIGAPVCVVCGSTTYKTMVIAESEDINYIIEHASECSVHSHREQICRGFIDYNGLRIGICGTGIYKEGKLHSVEDISSLNIRVPAEVKGIFNSYTSYILPPKNTLIISPPGFGKTTALRELIRVVSDNGYRVALVDERNEIAAKYREFNSFDLGVNTDVMTNLSKSDAADIILRSMNPEIIAVDELSGHGDMEIMRNAALNGIVLFATAHGRGTDDIKKKGLDFFESYVVIQKADDRYLYEFKDAI